MSVLQFSVEGVDKWHKKAVVHTFKSILCRCFNDPCKFEAPCKLDRVLKRHFAHVCYIRLIGHQDHVVGAFWRCVLHVTLNGGFQLYETLSVAYVENCNTTVCISVVSLRYWSESFLTCCIPHLQLNLFGVDLQTLHLEVKPYCALVSLVKGVLDEAHQERCFPAVRGTDQNKFVQVVHFALGVILVLKGRLGRRGRSF